LSGSRCLAIFWVSMTWGNTHELLMVTVPLQTPA